MSGYVRITLVVDEVVKKAVGYEVKPYKDLEHVVNKVYPRLKPIEDTPELQKLLKKLLKEGGD